MTRYTGRRAREAVLLEAPSSSSWRSPLDADGVNAFHKVKLPWLRRRIEEGLKLFGMRTEHMLGITGFQLMPAYVQNFCHVLPGGGI